MLAHGVRWFDDWFAVEDVAPGVVAIGEPRFHQFNWSYLITGQRRALMFDTGTGVRDLALVVRSLTSLPVTALPSHIHYDHTGCINNFANVALADLPVLRACERNGLFEAPEQLFLGSDEGMTWKPVKISQWLAIASIIDLGGRGLEIIHTPGHSPDSISLFDEQANLMFAADFVYPGQLYAQIPGADLADYLASARQLSHDLAPETRVFCAHGMPDAAGNHRAPVLGKIDITDLIQTLEELRASGNRPGVWPVNERMSLLLGDTAFQAWQST